MKNSFSRTAALAAGTVMMLCCGAIYAWSIYFRPFYEGLGWTSAELGSSFSVIIASFCLGGLFGGFETVRRGAFRTIPIGGLLGAIGYILCFFIDYDRLWLLKLGCVFIGSGSGIVYNAVIPAVSARYPEKRATVSGVLLMGFGSGALILGTGADVMIQSPLAGWHLTYVFTGLMLLGSAFIGRYFVSYEGDADEETAVLPFKDRRWGLSPFQMVTTPAFWLFFAVCSLGCFIGCGVLCHGRYMALESGASVELSALTVGLFAFCNGLGRFIFGYLHDKKGSYYSLLADCILLLGTGITALILLYAGAPAPAFTAAVALCGVGFGALPTISAAGVSDLFGRLHQTKNYGIMTMMLLPASFASAIAGRIQTASGSYTGAFWLFIALEAAALTLTLLLPREKAKIKRP